MKTATVVREMRTGLILFKSESYKAACSWAAQEKPRRVKLKLEGPLSIEAYGYDGLTEASQAPNVGDVV